jgi:hypothetical protein
MIVSLLSKWCPQRRGGKVAHYPEKFQENQLRIDLS